jgi:hypothetical protein
MRHIRVGQLWVQEKNENGELAYKKVAGEFNCADAMTKYLAEKVMMRHLEFMGQIFVTGRSDSSLKL